MAGTDLIQTTTLGSSLIVRFMNPGLRNPLSVQVIERLVEIVREVRADPRITRLVFTGSGDTFASGADLREIDKVSPEGARAFARRGQGLMSAVAELDAETVAAINGYCFGGALDLALACDRRIAAPGARFAHPGAGLGIITGWGGTQRLPRLVGTANALELFFTASPIDAERALRIGLIDRIDGDPLTAALAQQPALKI